MLGKKLTEIRKSKNIKRKDLARKLKTSYETVRRWEKDLAEIPIHKLDKICGVLNIPPSYLLGEESTTIEYPINSTNSKKKIKANKILPTGSNYVLVKVKDAGMNYKGIEAGDLAIIDINDTQIDGNSIFALSLDNRILLRRAKKLKNEIIVISYGFQDCDISIYHKSEVNIIGKVVRIIRKL